MTRTVAIFRCHHVKIFPTCPRASVLLGLKPFGPFIPLLDNNHRLIHPCNLLQSSLARMHHQKGVGWPC